MTLTQHPPPTLPAERILLFGKEGTGKTNAVLSIARRCPDAQFHVIDTDYSASYERLMATDFADVGERGNVTVYVTGPSDWQEIISAASQAQKAVRQGDWVVVDSISPTWSAVQDFFVEKVHGNSIEDYLLDIRIKKQGKGKSTLEAFDGWMDWSVINPMYFRLYKILMSHPGHLLLTAEGQALGDNDGKAVRDVYGPVGMRPVGQKKLGFLTHTVIATGKARSGEYHLTTVKDRGRVDMDETPVDDFAKTYLRVVAGWKPAKMGEA